MRLTFLETPVFTGLVTKVLSDDDYRLLQELLLSNPLAGQVIPGTCGCRKLRWSLSDRPAGKRRGTRVIYFFRQAAQQILLLLIYDHRDVDDLTPLQKKQFASITKMLK